MYPIATWQRSAFNKIEHLFNLELDSKWNELDAIINDMHIAYDEVLENTKSLENTSQEYLYYKNYVLWEYLSIKSIFALRSVGIEITKSKILETLISKQRDYGKENIARFGTAGLLIRVHDKLARLQNLMQRSQNNFNAAIGINSVKDESIVDTIIDVIGYSVIGLMWLCVDEESGVSEFMLPLV
jgi:hypothetical protein